MKAAAWGLSSKHYLASPLYPTAKAKADVSYNDFRGTAAADISDHTDRYKPIGVSFYASYEDSFGVSFLCRDAERSTDGKDYIVKMSFENDLSKDDFFALFKRFNVVVMLKHDNYGQMNREYPDEDISFDNSKKTNSAKKHRRNNDGRNK
jgi:hypothetical protein